MTPLRQRFIEDMQLRGLAPTTQRSYLHYVVEYAKFYHTSPEHLDLEAVRHYQLYLSQERRHSPQSINTFVSAVQFLYLTTLEMPWEKHHFPRARVPETLPVVLSPGEVQTFFHHVEGVKNRAVLLTCYGAGLRISEAVALRIADIDSQRSLIRVQGGKGAKDRYAMLSPALLELLRAYYRLLRPWARDLAVSLLAASPAPHRRRSADRLSRSLAAERNAQTRHSPHLASQLRHPLIGKRNRHAHHSSPAGSQPHRYHGPLHRRFAGLDRRHRQSVGPDAPTARRQIPRPPAPPR